VREMERRFLGTACKKQDLTPQLTLKPKKRKIGFEVRESRARYGTSGRKRPC